MSSSSSNGSNDPTPVFQDTALAVLIVCPLILALPPRKFDLYTMGLGGAWIYSANFLYSEGQQGRLHRNLPIFRNVPLEVRQKREQEWIKRQEAIALAERQRREVVIEGQKARPITERERQIAEDNRKLEEGEGLTGIITDQIREVWYQRKGNDGGRDPKESDGP